MSHSSKKAVITAIVTNSIVTVTKFFSAVLSGSTSMMNEAVHSLMDMLNQCFLLLGLKAGEGKADEVYAFGHGQKKYLWNLWSAIGLFSIGAGLGLAHAWHAWNDRDTTEVIENINLLGFDIVPLYLNLAVLLEGYSFLVAFKEYLIAMRKANFNNPFKYLVKAEDPTLVAVVLEDSVAMFGLLLASLGIILSAITGNVAWDIAFSAAIAVLLGVIAFYLGYTNMRYLADMRDVQAEKVFEDIIKIHPEIRRYHDLRSIILDESHTILVAEIELMEESIVPRLQKRLIEETKAILDLLPNDKKQDEKIKNYAICRAAVHVTLTRAEEIIDEIEQEIKARLPRVDHITIEVEGIATAENNSNK